MIKIANDQELFEKSKKSDQIIKLSQEFFSKENLQTLFYNLYQQEEKS